MTAEASKMPPTPEKKIRRREEKEERRMEQSPNKGLEKGLEGTFPASDPVAVTQPPKNRKEKQDS